MICVSIVNKNMCYLVDWCHIKKIFIIFKLIKYLFLNKHPDFNYIFVKLKHSEKKKQIFLLVFNE